MLAARTAATNAKAIMDFFICIHLRSYWYIALYPVREYDFKVRGMRLPFHVAENKIPVKRYGIFGGNTGKYSVKKL